jgi:hypothetical protein
MLAASVQRAHPRWDSPRGQRHICAGTRPHLRRDSPTSAPGLLYACRRRLARQSCGPVRQSRPAPMKMRRAQCCARGWRCACATRISCLCVRVSCVRVFVSVAPERSSSCCRCVAVNRRAMECALSTCEPNAHDKAAQVITTSGGATAAACVCSRPPTPTPTRSSPGCASHLQCVCPAVVTAHRLTTSALGDISFHEN